MLANTLRSVTVATILGCSALFLVRQGPIQKVLRIAVGVFLMVVTVQSLLSGITFPTRIELDTAESVAVMQETQEQFYWDSVAKEAESMVMDYFSEHEMEVDVSIRMEGNTIERIILCPAQAYDWSQEDTKTFTEWSGIPQEKQEWIWN